MNESVVVREAGLADRLPVFRMLELYQHDLSDIWDQELDAHGEYGYFLDRFWIRGSECFAYVVLCDHHYAGVALVDRSVKVGKEGYWMEQFFILKKYRRRSIGRLFFEHIVLKLPGKWEIGQMEENDSAQNFWHSVIGRYTNGNYIERVLKGGGWEGTVQCFETI